MAHNDHCKRVRYVIRLYISGNAPNSRIAQDNLRRLQEELPENEFEVEIVDVNANPGAALEHGIFITPTLHVLEPEPGGMVYGNLNDARALQRLFRDDR